MSAVYKAIAAVQKDLSAIGIKKDRQATGAATFRFRGIDDVYDALAPLLPKHGLCIIPRMTERESVERRSAKGNALFFVTVKAEFDFVATEDGSKHTACTYGEAMDSSDKATNKAMSAAYKYAAFQTFCIPLEGDDADEVSEPVKSEIEKPKKIEPPFPEGPCGNRTQLKAVARDFWRDVKACDDADQLDALLASNRALMRQIKLALPDWWNGGTGKEGEAYEGLGETIAKCQTELAEQESLAKQAYEADLTRAA